MNIFGNLRKSEKRVLEVLANSKKNLTQKEIIALTKLSERSVKYALSNLVASGYLGEKSVLSDMRTKRYFIQEKYNRTGNEDDEFELYDLRVIVEKAPDKNPDGHKVGDYFDVIGGYIRIPYNKLFPLYTLAAVLPLLPAKQRETHPNDWMSTDERVVCPDPNCSAIIRIERIGTRKFKHSEVTFVPLKRGEKDE